MDASRFRQWLRHIYQTQADELSCADCFALLPQYVEREIAGEAVAETMPRMKRLLDQCRNQCRACYEEYEILSDLARLEMEGQLPSADDVGKQA